MDGLKLVLYEGELPPGTKTFQGASISVSGDLALEAQDVGAGPREFWGDSDYEWFVTVVQLAGFRRIPQTRMAQRSGRRDSNSGPLVPQTSALTRLRHAPWRPTP